MNEIEWNGETITEPGIYKGIDIKIYHANGYENDDGDWVPLFDAPALSSTNFKELIRRPSEYWAYSTENPNRFSRPDKKHFIFGKAAHALILGDEDFGAAYRVRPDKILSEKTGKEVLWHASRNECKAWMEKHKDFTVVTTKDLEAITYISRNMARNDNIRKNGILNGLVERSVFCKVDGIWLKIRPDVIPLASGEVVDLKSAADVSYRDLERSLMDTGYHITAGLTRLVIEIVLGADWFTGYSFVFVEKKVPYDVRVMQLKDGAIDLGQQQVQYAIAKFKECWDADEWPGYDGIEQHVDYIDLPTWGHTRINEDLEMIRLGRKK